MRYLNKEQIKANIAYDKLLKAKKICAACGRPFTKVKRAKADDSLCTDCFDALD
jgi:hypothetical protein